MTQADVFLRILALKCRLESLNASPQLVIMTAERLVESMDALVDTELLRILAYPKI